MSTPDDARRRMESGDREAFAAFVQATSARLVRLAARILGDVAEAEDVVQDAYCRAFDALRARRFDGRAELSTWLHRIVINGALDHLRRRRTRSQPQPPAPLVLDGAEALEARAALELLARWMAELPPKQRVALVLKELEGLSSAEIASALACSEGAVEQHLVRARATLRERRSRE